MAWLSTTTQTKRSMTSAGRTRVHGGSDLAGHEILRRLPSGPVVTARV
jgi:hypothetical protein